MTSDSVRFLFMADCQLGCYASFSGLTPAQVTEYAERGMTVESVPRVQGFDWDARRLEDAVDAARLLRPDLVIVGGDMVDDASDPEQLAAVQRIASRLDGIPLHWVPGNHDAAPDALVPTAQSLAAYRSHFGADHYAFELRGVRFIVVNTVVWDHPEEVPDELEAQLAFLESSLRDAAGERSRRIFVLGHHPLFTADAEEPDTYWNIPQPRRRELLKLLGSFGTDAYFCGHWHRNGGGIHEGLEVVVTGPVGYPLGADPSGFRQVETTQYGVDHRYVATRAVVGQP
jgi:Icc-related predicted phosphoesterase